MSAACLGPALQRATRLTMTANESDAELLQRFQSHREESAFAALVERYGRLVFSVCRHVLNHEQDAEDAFQATFLVLATQAHSIRQSTSISSWLYGVAYRTAQKAKRTALRRRSREQIAAERATPEHCEISWRELLEVLHQEVHRLDEKLRAPFVLCCLEGMTKRDAAAQLGWKEGTVSARLAEARNRLRDRLTRRGITLSAALAAFTLNQPSASLARSVSTLPTTRALVSAQAVAYASGSSLISSMLGKIAAVILAIGGLIGVGMYSFAEPKTEPTNQPKPVKKAEPAPEPAPQPASEERIPIEGRILDLEGRPIKGVSVDVERIGKAKDGDLGAWIEQNVELRKNNRYLNDEGLDITRLKGTPRAKTVQTDEKGIFRIDDFENDRVLRLLIHGPTVETKRLWAITRNGPKEGWIADPYGVYPAKFDITLGPCKPIVGVIRERATGKPIPGVTVVEAHRSMARTKTDEEGRYRLLGAPKRSKYTLAVGGGPGIPYFDVTIHDIGDTPGLAPITVDIEMERGIEVTGTLTNKETGKPISGRVRYFYPQDNPNLKNYTTLEGAKIIVSRWGRVDEKGRFTTLAIPGPGALVATADDEAGYVLVDANKELRKVGSRSFPVGSVHAVIPIEVAEDNPNSQGYEIKLVPGKIRAGQVIDPDNKPVEGVKVAGLTKDDSPRALANGQFELRGLDETNTHVLIFIHEKKNLGAVVEVTGKDDGPIDAKLQPLAALEGRLVDQDDKALANRSVKVYLNFPRDTYINLPREIRLIRGAYGIVAGAWDEFTAREAKTDKDGRFHLTGLLPGQKYTLIGGEGDLNSRQGTMTHFKEGIRLEAGQSRDLGDIKEELTTDQRR